MPPPISPTDDIVLQLEAARLLVAGNQDAIDNINAALAAMRRTGPTLAARLASDAASGTGGVLVVGLIRELLAQVKKL